MNSTFFILLFIFSRCVSSPGIKSRLTSFVSPVTDIMMIKFLLLSLLGLLSVSRAEISSDGLMFAERMAFVLCDSDKETFDSNL